MTELDVVLVALGDQLQGAWRSDRMRTRRRMQVLATSALVAVIAATGAALAAGVLPISVRSASGKPTAQALVSLHKLYPERPSTTPKPFPHSLALRLDQAMVVGRVTGSETGRLDLIVIPTAPRGACLDAARPDGTAYMSGCSTFPQRVVDTAGRRSIAFQTTLEQDATAKVAALNMALRSAPPGAVRADVRTRSGFHVPSVLSDGWLVYVRHPGPDVLVRFYDKGRRRLLSYYGG
jgi:hypothetical protein